MSSEFELVRPDPTPSNALSVPGPRGADWIRAHCDALVANVELGGVDFGRALSQTIDEAIRAVLDTIGGESIAVVALGSYARGELCPGSDVDVLLLHENRPDLSAVADALWYPLWDAGFVLGHATRRAKESLKLADKDLDTLTALLEARVVGGGIELEAVGLIDAVRALASGRRQSLIGELADASVVRRLRPGPVAEMLEPNLKEGAGGLRDLHALAWAGWAVGPPGGHAALSETGILRPDDRAVLEVARDQLLAVRVALHRVTGGRSDVLALQDQDAVATVLHERDADALARTLAATSRAVAWIAEDAWTRLRSDTARRRRSEPGEQLVAEGVVERDGRIALAAARAGSTEPTPTASIDGALLLRVARAAAERGLTIDRDALATLRAVPAPSWSADIRSDFMAVLRSGARGSATFEALDHEDLITRILPEWENVRFRPQRNAYHRYMVDRHLLETVAEAARLLDDPTAPDARPAQDLAEPDLLLLGALLHDIAKGRPGDHATQGAGVAREVAGRLGLRSTQVETLVWLVQDHLLMADTATRRDLADPMTIERFGDRVVDEPRLRLLTLLTVADSRATGPAAWGPGKAALVRELYDRTRTAWSGRAPVTAPGLSAADPALHGPGIAVVWEELGDGRLRCAVGAPDRPGLLAGVAGALSLEGFDIATAEGQSLPDGRAAEFFVGTDRFDRLIDDKDRERCAATIEAVLAGDVSVADGLRERRAAYRRSGAASLSTRLPEVRVSHEESADATVVEVFAPDEFGLLATVAGVFGELGLDVGVARVATTGEQAVDVFYITDRGAKVTDPDRVAALKVALLGALARD